MIAIESDVAVLGAGLTGVTTALELARAGVSVTLIDQDERPMNRASLRNEGKVHLGFVFANDRTLATAKLMIEGALRFRSVLARLIGPDAEALCLSHPFVYLVPKDSLLTPDEIGRRFSAIEHHYRQQLQLHHELNYLGSRTSTLFQPISLSAIAPHLRPGRFAGAFRTAEVAVDTHELSVLLRAAVAREPRIRFLASHTVASVERLGDRFQIEGTRGGEGWCLGACQVVNALWENRFKIDRSVGLEHPPGWLHRLKYRVIARVPESMRSGPSATLIVGPYGDVVIRPDGTAYFSWYPIGLRGWTDDLAPPSSWNQPCRGELSTRRSREVASGILDAIDAWYPGAAQSTPITVDAGAIVAYGSTDVDDPESGLHDRTRVGVTSSDGYHSVDPGKLTTAPYFGVLAAHAVLEARGTALATA